MVYYYTFDLHLIADTGGDPHTRFAGHHGTNRRYVIVGITTKFLTYIDTSTTTQQRSILYFSLSTW